MMIVKKDRMVVVIAMLIVALVPRIVITISTDKKLMKSRFAFFRG